MGNESGGVEEEDDSSAAYASEPAPACECVWKGDMR
jgi:hypothetical protein